MYRWLHIFLLLFFLALLGSQGIVAAAESKAVHTMAEILLKLNHYPSASEKETLQKLVSDKDTSAQERMLAQALINVQHTARPDDKPKLQALMTDESAPASVKTLASVLYNLNHTATDTDKEKLKNLLQ
jgi:hypothetical protein